MKHIKAVRIGAAVIILGLIGGFVFAKFGKSEAKVSSTITNVSAVPAAVSSISTDVEYASKLAPVQEVTIAPKIAGKVASVNVQVGDKVEKGQVLFTLDSADLEAQLQEQQASLESSKANLAKTQGSAYDQQVIQAEQAVQDRQIAYNDAKNKYDLNKQLYAAGAISKTALDDYQNQYQSAQVDLKAAQDNLNLLKEKSGPESISVATAQVNQAAAGVEAASEQLKNTVITSPISGIVSVRNVDEGEIVSSATAALTVIDTDTMTAEISVPDKLAAQVKKGQTVPVKINALNDKTFNGVVDYVSPDADSKSQAYTIKITLQTTDDLKSGMFARAILPESKKDNILTVPNQAVKVENGVSYVYTVAEGAVKKVAVTTGLANDKITEITSGLKAGDEVITEGQLFLNEGQKVNIVK